MPFYKLSKLFQPKIIIPPGKTRLSEVTSLSQKLLIDLGFIRPTNNGTYVYLPLCLRSLEKLKCIVRSELSKIEAQEIVLPSLTPLKLLEKTNRSNIPELFKLKDRRDNSLVLNPTHEESIVNLMTSVVPSYKSLPLLLYQISNKFRDEIKPKYGLMRSREFLMKDLYCFSANVAESLKLYDTVNQCYRNIFERIGVQFACVEGSPGDIGGYKSHEFHTLSNIGEDKLQLCSDCGQGVNIATKNIDSKCKQCGSTSISLTSGIEVGHSFLLGTAYTKPLEAYYISQDRSHQLLEMSCHGIGITRLLAAIVETSASPENIRWPLSIAPFSVCIIPPKMGSKEENTTISISKLAADLSEIFPDDVIVDDRTELTIGKRIVDAKRIGFPYLIVVGKSSINTNPTVEFCDNIRDSIQEVSLPDILSVCALRN